MATTETPGTLAGTEPLPDEVIAEIRRSRRHPVPLQKDYLHLRTLLRDLALAIRELPASGHDILDVFCGTSPYRDLLPVDARYVGMDVNRRYGVPDVETIEFLPFEDESFDVVLCIEGFHYVSDPEHGIAEMRRVLRAGGWAIMTVPLMWEYDRATFEGRYTGHELTRLFDGWSDVEVIENGGRGVTWATVTGDTVDLLEQGLVRRVPAARMTRPLFAATYLAINVIGAQIERLERRFARTTFVLPMNLLVRARRT
jgi:SAM-dependent methyltransferase